MQKLWFKNKRYGWGWTPATWQGWLVLVIFLALIIGNVLRLDAARLSTSDALMNILPQNALLVLILILICYRTGEKPRWRWGDDSVQPK
jgi:hypothetical protein